MLSSLKRVCKEAPRLKSISGKRDEIKDTSLTIIVPTYNEEYNIENCLLTLLNSTSPCKSWNIIVVDDSSTDKTMKVAKKVQLESEADKNRLQLIKAGDRPKDKRWVGKNWPCFRASQKTNSSWILFIDADVQIASDTLKRALTEAINESYDLLSLAPRITCSCSSEWMVQPIIACLLAIGFPINKTNNPYEETAFAAGPFMLFRQSAYKSVGGHHEVAGEVVEDIALARLIKTSGYKLQFSLGLDSVKLGMYSNLKSLWEGWSKNWFIGLDRNVNKALFASLVVFWIFSLPWIIIPLAFILSSLGIFSFQPALISIILALITIALQYFLRQWCRDNFNLPIKHWYLMSLGGIILGCIGPVSIMKTITGKGWTWKGRNLA